MKALFIETFYGGSHRNFADRWMAGSSHEFSLFSLPARFWKWRQAGSAFHFAEYLPETLNHHYAAAVLSGMCDLAHLKSLRPDLPPVMLYIHENQFAYPLKAEENRDFRYGITELNNILSADAVVFNSRWNRESFFAECRSLFDRLPDAVPYPILDRAEEKSEVIYPGVDIRSIRGIGSSGKNGTRGQFPDGNGVPLVIWNHRHEYDKNPDTSFRVLESLARRGLRFNLALLGERFRKAPESFDRCRTVLADRIVVDDYPSRDEYLKWLAAGDIVISSAIHENFGLSVVEAVAAGCWPLLPRRLAYPEVLPIEEHERCLWDSEEDFTEKLAQVIRMDPGERSGKNAALSRSMEKYDWSRQAFKLDSRLNDISAN